MARVVLIDWNATAAKPGLAALRRAAAEERPRLLVIEDLQHAELQKFSRSYTRRLPKSLR